MLQGGWETYQIWGYFKQGERKVATPVFSHPFFFCKLGVVLFSAPISLHFWVLR